MNLLETHRIPYGEAAAAGARARRPRVRKRALRLRRPPAARRHHAAHRAGPDGGLRRQHRQRQEHAGQAAAALLRTASGRICSTASTSRRSTLQDLRRRSAMSRRTASSPTAASPRTSPTAELAPARGRIAAADGRGARLHRRAAAGLRHAGGRTRQKLSGGQRQRIALARAPSSRTRRSWCSTKRPRRSTTRPRPRSSARSTGWCVGRTTSGHRAPAVHRAPGRCDPRAGGRPHRRVRHPRALLARGGPYARAVAPADRRGPAPAAVFGIENRAAAAVVPTGQLAPSLVSGRQCLGTRRSCRWHGRARSSPVRR